jgi:hypothetical protein
MSVTAPSPRTREVPAPATGARAPDDRAARPLERLLASRPERDRRSVGIAVAGALVLHLLALLALLLAGPLGGPIVFPSGSAGLPRETIVTLLLPGIDVSGAGRAGPSAPVATPAPTPLVAPTGVPARVPAPPARPAAGPQQGAGGAAGPGEAGAGQAGGAGAAGGGGTAAERLRPSSWDRRLWETPDELIPAQSDQDRVADRVRRRTDAVSDSAAAVADAARKATNWTIKDRNGGEWGITPGKLHLGSITLPLPVYFGTPPGRRDDAEREQANWEEIQRSAAQAEVRHTFDERVKAIRARKDAEHQAEQKTKADSTAASPPID